MKVTVVPCGPAATNSERTAVERLKAGLISVAGDGEWVLLTNLSFSVTHQLQSDEIDIVAIGPSGVRVIEVKHWSAQWVAEFSGVVEREADKLTLKARKVGSTLRKVVPSLNFADSAFLITREPAADVKRLTGKVVRGARFHTLKQWQAAVGIGQPETLSRRDVLRLSNALAPEFRVAVGSSLRRLAGYANLELLTPKDERFHRVYRGLYARRQEPAILHVYDLSAAEGDAESRARWEFDALHRLQLHPWVPRVLETYREVPGYAGELFFFALADTAAPSIETRAADESWDPTIRVSFARNAVRAVSELHEETTDGRCMVHRNLTPETILVKHDNSPVLTGFQLARNPADVTIASVSVQDGTWCSTVAPEIRMQGLGASDERSDVYSLCASLGVLFEGGEDDKSRSALATLERGAEDDPAARPKLSDLEGSLAALLGETGPEPPPPPARYWTEEQVVRFRDRDYRIVSKLGSGGVGAAYKVVEIDRSVQPEEEIGCYVGKVAYEERIGRQVLKGYMLARPHLGGNAALSTIFEPATEWRENDFIALMTWVEGSSLHDFIGVFPLLAEDRGEQSAEDLALEWLKTVCGALDTLHSNNLVHGDVSLRNMIVSDSGLVLTDYDCVGRIGEPVASPGTVVYCAPPGQDRTASPSDDIYALAASFFHAVFDREPFRFGGSLAKERGLNWDGIEEGENSTLRRFLDKATDPDADRRFASAAVALEALEQVSSAKPSPPPRRPNKVEWLRYLLQSYPGSHWGNRETRGLDTDFAARTYVETELEQALFHDLRMRRVRLAILCGNAGDGKTALLQHLAERLGLDRCSSSQRILEGRTNDGLTVRMNLDGSASWQGRSADEILDEFLEPFQQGLPGDDIAHLLAINDGRLLEWMEDKDTPLTESLENLLDGESAGGVSHIRFISLNQRSLVGRVAENRNRIETGFLERLLDRLYGGDEAAEIWSPCSTCSAQEHCEVLRAGRTFGPQSVPGTKSEEARTRARQRLFEALQAVHLRGETHITVRELRAALIYILFGVHFCTEYHAGVEVPPYWNRAFSADSPERQGETLAELVRFDPALEAHPRVDRSLIREEPSVGNASLLGSARRRAYFEWTEQKISDIAGEPHALGLAQGRHLSLFRDVALKDGRPEIDILREKLCKGVSRLGDLPPQALRDWGTPLRIPPRTPTETRFWVRKALDSFRLEADLPPAAEGLDRLHRQAVLVYRYRDNSEERLHLGANLFHQLLELSDGYQLGDVSSDDTFARLSIFVQRLLREDDREIFAWNPIQDERIYRIWVATEDGGEERRQTITITSTSQEAPQ